MTEIFKSLSLIAAIALASPFVASTAHAQSDGSEEPPATEEETAEGEAPIDPYALSMGVEDVNVGDIYLEGQYTDWQIRCAKTEDGNDPCQLYQLLDDGAGSPIAEINIFPLTGQGQAVAGATVITPLETLLTQQLSLGVDGGALRKYPFSWCTQIGCFSRIGFSAADVQAFKNGAQARMVIVPVAAPDQKITLNVSLSGFTAGFTALQEIYAGQQ